jgi:hypothetical protein
MTAPARPVCEGFAWIGQSLLCCDECGWPWFLHAGDRKSTALFSRDSNRGGSVKPFRESLQAQIPDLLAAWEANALWQAERGAWSRDWEGKDRQAPNVERQVGKDFPYPTGPTRTAP